MLESVEQVIKREKLIGCVFFPEPVWSWHEKKPPNNCIIDLAQIFGTFFFIFYKHSLVLEADIELAEVLVDDCRRFMPPVLTVGPLKGASVNKLLAVITY